MLWEERVGIDGWDWMEVCQNIEDNLRNILLFTENKYSSEMSLTSYVCFYIRVAQKQLILNNYIDVPLVKT